MTTNTKNHQRKVHFALNDETDSRPAPHQELTTEMIEDMWYSPQYIDYFKQSAKYMVLNREKLNEEELCMSGLERYLGKRSEYRRSALFYTLQAQRKTRNPEFIRAVSRRCTAWARSIATQQGFEDYCEVYDPLARLLADPQVSVEILKSANKKQKMEKERSMEEEQQPVQKRQRVC